MVCCLSRIQGPIQAQMKPSIWCICCSSLHSHKERWHISLSPDEHISHIRTAVDKVQADDPDTTYEIKTIDELSGCVRLYCYTKAEWLDVMEIDFITGKVHSYSTGVLPTWFPLCFFFNALLCFIPFYDMEMNLKRTKAIRTALGIQLETGEATGVYQ